MKPSNYCFSASYDPSQIRGQYAGQDTGQILGQNTSQNTGQNARRRGRLSASLSTGLLATLLASCSAAQSPDPVASGAGQFIIEGSAGTVVQAETFDAFNAPWAMTFLPDGRLLVSEKSGTLKLVSADGSTLGAISGVPEARAQGQGGLGDVVLHPDFTDNALVYLSYVEHDGDRSGSVVVRAALTLTESGGSLGPLERLWEQQPKVSGNGHFSQRIAFDDERMLFITSGDRQKKSPAQDMSGNLGKLIRLHDDGRIPDNNPFSDEGGVAAELWSIGHRNPLGLAFDSDGQLWSHEMGPRGGDELNRIEAGENYGWPEVSDGTNYSFFPISDHDTDPSYAAPALSWVPSISPAGFVLYDGDVFSDWNGHGLMGGLSSEALIRVTIEGNSASEAERFEWGSRVREVEQGPDGALWVLEDQNGGRLIRLTPAE